LCEHVKDIEHEYRECEIIFDIKVDSIIINLGVVDSGSDLDDSDESNAADGDGKLYGIFEFLNSD
jgi:hypothetical protein